MKKIAIVMLSLLAAPAMAQAQGFLDKVKKFAGTSDTLGYWKSATYVIEGPGSITLEDGSKQDGTVQFMVTGDNDDLRRIWFTPASEMKPKKLQSGEIKYFTVKGTDFYAIRMKEDDMAIGNARIFMEQINQSPEDKFRMYRLRKVEKAEGPSDKPWQLKRGYFVMLPDFKNAHEIIDMTFTPFAKKMSEYLKDCPELSKKIADKEEGYKYNMFRGAGNDEVFIRVMQEYNACGK